MLDIIFMFLLSSVHHLISAQEENEAALEMGREKGSIMLLETMQICHERQEETREMGEIKSFMGAWIRFRYD